MASKSVPHNSDECTVYIYLLIDPRTNLPFYVGQTSNPHLRLNQHLTYIRSIYNARRKTLDGLIVRGVVRLTAVSPMVRYLGQMLESGHHPSFQIVDSASKSEAAALEVAWYEKLKSDGCLLMNANKPGRARTRTPKT